LIFGEGSIAMQFLRVQRGSIVDEAGNPVRLRGTCLGGWMNMEDFISGHPGVEHTLRDTFREVLGDSRATFFFERFLDHFFGEDDVRYLRSLGFTVLRIPLNYRHFERDDDPFHYREDGFRRLDRVLDWCRAAGLYVILDLHAAPGWQNVHWHSDNDTRHSLLWTHAHFQDRVVRLWEALAERYATRPEVAGYDLLNEPCVNTPHGDDPWNVQAAYRPLWEPLNRLYARTVAAIRRQDAKHIVFLEGDHYAQLFSGLAAPFDANLAYSSHHYTAAGFGPGPYPGVIQPRRAAAGTWWDTARLEQDFLESEGARFTQQHDVPLWVGEFGAVYNGPPEERPDRLRALKDQIAVFERHGIHWTTWTYKDIGVMGLVTVRPESPYLTHIAEVLRAKHAVGTDDWMSWLPETPVQRAVYAVADQLWEAFYGDRDPERARQNRWTLRQATVAVYASRLAERRFAELFRDLSEAELDRLLASFAFSQCTVRDELADVLRTFAAGPA
jgi:endoglucanase